LKKDVTLHLRHILDCVARIEDYVRDGREAFFDDPKTQDAVIRNLEVIGQAVKDVGKEDLGSRDDSVPWGAVAGLRNVLAHQYLGVDLKLVWRIVERDLPVLKAAVQKLIADAAGAVGH
jgi:uncharacterized protein with HEPN domain